MLRPGPSVQKCTSKRRMLSVSLLQEVYLKCRHGFVSRLAAILGAVNKMAEGVYKPPSTRSLFSSSSHFLESFSKKKTSQRSYGLVPASGLFSLATENQNCLKCMSREMMSFEHWTCDKYKNRGRPRMDLACTFPAPLENNKFNPHGESSCDPLTQKMVHSRIMSSSPLLWLKT
jgi:hypothetical protein